MKLADFKTAEERVAILQDKVSVFAERAYQLDKDDVFPFENFRDLKEIGYPSLTIPKKYGGLGISLTEMLKMQEIIAKMDGSTALGIGWHMGITKHLGETDAWEPQKYESVMKDVLTNSALLNNAASERATGSPTRGGRPETTAERTNDGWLVNGRKTFTTLAPVLSYFIVSASIKGTDKTGNFLVERERDGVSIDETWDSIAMKGTGSHDLVLDQVKLDDSDFVEELSSEKKPAAGWLLHIPACYLGIARAAQETALQFASSYSPNSIKGTISDLPNVQQKLGEMELLLMESEYFLYGVSEKWDHATIDQRSEMKPLLGAVKLSVVNKAIEVVDLAMRINGARSLSSSNPLQRYYRDVRAGLHNPPMDDMTIIQLASKSISEFRNNL
ncbi:acyl-CoA/acyl-ACP dehydrogenase [Virgibacillus sp. AGTR]|uniref:Acyl-CoA/acyl-ACP dehydrogenase n=1 Tax=Virgibacillus salarius TaxID=447199 RepID=A0A941DTF7_9BACI|nr:MULTISPECIES: acyl-CoA dehydrogenase family protein [Bacillaceae]MBR7796854.1 acyl-CoA/acyl-ACP dehydrogenase [Virgibacillus salarius]MCC2249977.1 acyl-CoA/acyl-ACP dehydrogenase [Virgibacillus sp. AGTR]NAZ09564.1 acyl-CoA dehydrogenase [Agaribacter marinus]QRZ18167.1 acyl-CoA/acyl-ACP dehydrogenase [Virgibacillus sp. AGTR]